MSNTYIARAGAGRLMAVLASLLLVLLAAVASLAVWPSGQAWAVEDVRLSVDASNMTLEVGESATRPYELDPKVETIMLNGGPAAYPLGVSVVSSDPSVARALVQDSSLTVTGYAAGSVTLTLRVTAQNEGVVAKQSFEVTVSEPAAEGGAAGGSGAAADSGGGLGASADATGAAGGGSSDAVVGDGTEKGPGVAQNEGAGDAGNPLSPLLLCAIPSVLAIVVFVLVALVLRKRSGATLGVVALAVTLGAGGSLLASLCGPQAAFAYFDRGPVGIDLGQSAVEIKVGETLAIPCVITPYTDLQLPGCGMMECPDTCPDGCLDSSGQCTCAGLGYSTYTASVSCSSTDPSVARAQVLGGSALQVNGYAPGEVTITLRASLRQFSDGTAQVSVRVVEVPEEEPNRDEKPDEEPDERKESVEGGEGEANTNVVNGTGTADNVHLAAEPPAPEVSVDVESVAAAADAAPSMMLMELTQVDEPEEEPREPATLPDMRACLAASVAGGCCLVAGVAGRGGLWRRQRR